MSIDIKKFEAGAGFNVLHWEFGRFLVRRGNVAENDPDRDAIVLLAAKCLQAVEQGHSCLDLQKWYELPSDLEDAPLPSPLTLEEWRGIVGKYPGIVGKIDDAEAEKCTPLLFDEAHHLIYLNKYCRAEKEIAARLRDYIARGKRALKVNEQVLYEQIHAINELFKDKSVKADADPQQAAVAMALTHHFSILTGGPGTGKTTVLATILAMELNFDLRLRIGLAAPTGKASMQMLDSLNEELSLHLVKERLNTGVEDKLRALTSSTIHRMLGIGLDAKPRFDETNPLPYDLIVVDESSMISLRLMHQLCRAIPEGCRLLLVGDQNQLAAVEAGCLLGDFCSRCTLPATAAGGPYITRLVENHRSGIEDLKKFLLKINAAAGKPGSVSAKMQAEIDALYDGGNPAFRACEVVLDGNKRERTEALEGLLKTEVETMLSAGKLPAQFQKFFGAEKTGAIKPSLGHWRSLRCSGDEKDENNVFALALAHYYVESFRIICGIHDGPFGEISLNRLMSRITGKKKGDDGFPIIVSKNDGVLHLYNGDIGICWGGKVYFPKWVRKGNDLSFDCSRSYNILQLPPHDAAYAMTIHKSQGSGFDNVIMSLPERPNSVLCRELIYTGISRTKRRFLLWSPEELFRATIDRECVRWSGMPFRLQE